MKLFLRVLLAFVLFLGAAPAPAQIIGGGIFKPASAGGATNSCWDLTSINVGTDVLSTNGGCTLELVYAGDDEFYQLSPANKSGPTITYLEIKVEHLSVSGDFGVPELRVGAFMNNGITPIRPGYEVYSLGVADTGTMTQNFSDIWTTDSKLTFVTTTIMSLVMDRTDPAHPVLYASNDGTTYRASGDLNVAVTCCGGTLAIFPGASLKVAGDKVTLLTGTAITRTPKAGSTVLP